MARMMGRVHERWCDCNIEQFVSGAGEKCNHRYGVKRQRSIEKRELVGEIDEGIDALAEEYLDFLRHKHGLDFRQEATWLE